MPVAKPTPLARRRRILSILDGHDRQFGRTVALSIHVLIVLTAVAFAMSTVQGLPEAIQFGLILFEHVAVAVFATEYGLRLYCSPHRWRYVFSFWGIVDLLAWAPSLLLVSGSGSPFRLLRLLQVFRVLKIVRYSRALRRLGGAFWLMREELTLFVFVACFLLYLSSVGIYFLENPVQPDVFSSVPASFWWAIVTLTSVGYGDTVPITDGGRLFTGLILLVGVGVFAIPAGIITAALISDEIEEFGTTIEESLDNIESNLNDDQQ